MAPQVTTRRVPRTWLEKLLLWGRAYTTKVSDQYREVIGRGPSPEISQEAAIKRWNDEIDQAGQPAA
jgi:hypothetical protein